MITAAIFSALLTITPQSEIVLATNAPYATRLAAEELNFFMKGIFGSPLPVVNAPTAGQSVLVLGGGNSAVRDGFTIEATNSTVRIFGNDDDVPNGNVVQTCWYGAEAPWQPHFRRGTLFGVYEFLERYAGVRMYFPGEIGTIIPHAAQLVIPEGRLTRAPAFRYRKYGYEDGPADDSFKRLNWYRLRMETETMKCVHGHRRLKLYERFGKTHPEYFANHHNRHIREQVRRKAHLCHTSAVWDQIECDACTYFANGGTDTFDLMPQDGMTPLFRCNCPTCTAAYSKSRHYATDIIWCRTAEVAARVKARYPYARFTQMAYNPYGAIPTCALPDNLDVTVARRGPWARALPALDCAESDEVRAWVAKLGRPVMLWNYAGKWYGSIVRLPNVPQLAPRAFAAYYRNLAPVINGAFVESESDHWSYNYLNYYVFSRLCWDPAVDVEAILAEHHRLMFGPAAKPMAAFYDLLEEKWMACVAAGYAEIVMDAGLTSKHDTLRASHAIFTRDILTRLEDLLNTAAHCVASAHTNRTQNIATPPVIMQDDAAAQQARRIAWVREEYFLPLKNTYRQ